ncbi:MAG TPA: DUF4340 domain-containing protein [Candidatus Dormibacteraeota bacterium]|nr:DUF4340 domain-containing protein [Candidatus Dormibacteraeota bacterium]
MTSKSLSFWAILCGILFALVVVEHHFHPRGPSGPGRVLPHLKAAEVTSLQVRPDGQLEIRAERTNATWKLTEPLTYPARSATIESLLAVLEKLTPATYITRRELQIRPKAEAEYGFASPQATLIIQQGDYAVLVLVGALTAPGDQLFLQVVGDEGVFVVDAELLKYIPRRTDDWRDTALVAENLSNADDISVTNAGKGFELQHDTAKGPWRIVIPGFQARADASKIEQAIQDCRELRIRQFISDQTNLDLDAFGLAAPDLQLGFSQGTNSLVVLQFSAKGPTNAVNQIFVRRLGRNGIVTVETNLLASWRAQPNDFRDPHLVALAEPVAQIDVHGQEQFSLVHGTNDAWTVLPQNFAADPDLVRDLLGSLTGMSIVQFVKAVVPAPDLTNFGLATPSLEYTLKSAPTNSSANPTNLPIATLCFGTNQDDHVFVRRADEPSVYAVRLEDVRRLPSASFQFRRREIWNLNENDLASLTVRQNGKVKQSLRKAQYEWALAPGSQGIIEPLATEETVRGLCHLKAADWVARGETNRALYGFTNANPYQLTLEMKSGDKFTVEFGNLAPTTFPYAGVTLDGEFWVFEVPLLLCRDVLSYLSIASSP